MYEGREPSEESIEMSIYFVPHGLYLFLRGVTPDSIEVAAKGTVTQNGLNVEVPQFTAVGNETETHGNGLAITALTLHLGATRTEQQATHFQPDLSLPSLCRSEKLAWSAAWTLAAVKTLPGQTVQQTADTQFFLARGTRPASVRIEHVKVAPSHIVATIKTSNAGAVTITAPGLRKSVETLPAGTHKVALQLTSEGRSERANTHRSS